MHGQSEADIAGDKCRFSGVGTGLKAITGFAGAASGAVGICLLAAAVLSGIGLFCMACIRKKAGKAADKAGSKRQKTAADRSFGEKKQELSGIEKGRERKAGPESELTIASVSAHKDILVEFSILFGGTSSVAVRHLSSSLLLGRGKECDVDVVLGSSSEESKLTSRIHARITRRGGAVFIRDEKTMNHTFLNGMMISGEVPLADKDVIQLGKARVKINILREDPDRRINI